MWRELGALMDLKPNTYVLNKHATPRMLKLEAWYGKFEIQFLLHDCILFK